MRINLIEKFKNLSAGVQALCAVLFLYCWFKISFVFRDNTLKINRNIASFLSETMIVLGIGMGCLILFEIIMLIKRALLKQKLKRNTAISELTIILSGAYVSAMLLLLSGNIFLPDIISMILLIISVLVLIYTAMRLIFYTDEHYAIEEFDNKLEEKTKKFVINTKERINRERINH